MTVTVSELEHGHLVIVDLPIKSGDFPWLCKRLPEGIWMIFKKDTEYFKWPKEMIVIYDALTLIYNYM